MIKKQDRRSQRIRRHLRIRKKIFGTAEKPRLSVFKSQRHIYVQLIDDTKGHTILSASTLDPELRQEIAKTYNKEAAKKVGKLIAQRALSKGINQVVFDRGGFKYHGRIKELADAAREVGLKF